MQPNPHIDPYPGLPGSRRSRHPASPATGLSVDKADAVQNRIGQTVTARNKQKNTLILLIKRKNYHFIVRLGGLFGLICLTLSGCGIIY